MHAPQWCWLLWKVRGLDSEGTISWDLPLQCRLHAGEGSQWGSAPRQSNWPCTLTPPLARPGLRGKIDVFGILSCFCRNRVIFVLGGSLHRNIMTWLWLTYRTKELSMHLFRCWRRLERKRGTLSYILITECKLVHTIGWVREFLENWNEHYTTQKSLLLGIPEG